MDLKLLLTREEIDLIAKEFGEYSLIDENQIIIPCERLAEKKTSFGDDYEDDGLPPIFELIINFEPVVEGKFDVEFDFNTDYAFSATEYDVLEDVITKDIFEILGLVYE